MQKTLLFKALIVGALMLIIGIPLMMVQATISERMSFRDEAVRSIAADSVREQTMIGPVLIIPYTDEYEEQQDVTDEKIHRTKTVRYRISKRLVTYPNDLQINGNFETDHRYRGMHKVLVYSGQYAIAGDFTLPRSADLPHDRPGSIVTPGQPYVALAIDDVRGLRNTPKLIWDGKTIEFEQGSRMLSFKSGLHAPVEGLAQKDGSNVKFRFELGLDGIERQHFAPIAKNNQVTLTSKWPHPQFGGRFLPTPKNRRIDENGFSATWNIAGVATNAQQQLTRLEQPGSAERAAPGAAAEPELDRFSVGFIEPINIYSQADRAVKYGLLFVALTFAAFFIFEVLKQLPVHPVQYTLVGLALALFFLLLVSLSEHMQFWLAYLAASTACIALIGFYLAHVLRNWRRGLGFGCALTLLYGVLYSLLQSENNALMLGSILLFGVLSAIMIATRRVDWYQAGRTAKVTA